MTDYLSSLNQAQKQAVLHASGPAIVLAGAGSGKTKVLTTRATYLIKELKTDPSQILLVTFTNKAAGEMRDRVANLSGIALPHVGTFHALGAKILRRDGIQIGLDHNFIIYDADEQLTLIKQIYKEHGFDNKEYNHKGIKTAILFGSFARGDWNKSSDIDLFIYGDDSGFDKAGFERKLGREIQVLSYIDSHMMSKELDPKLLPNIARGFQIKESLEPFTVTVHA